jgi:hypothetical protein
LPVNRTGILACLFLNHSSSGLLLTILGGLEKSVLDWYELMPVVCKTNIIR